MKWRSWIGGLFGFSFLVAHCLDAPEQGCWAFVTNRLLQEIQGIFLLCRLCRLRFPACPMTLLAQVWMTQWKTWGQFRYFYSNEHFCHQICCCAILWAIILVLILTAMHSFTPQSTCHIFYCVVKHTEHWKILFSLSSSLRASNLPFQCLG